ncbi:hypothetical protein GC722_12445 [Auraticoccus sp. F435]|uniref:Uncharacterized protein n=1 Tax=Auraticoccus cholistanensis TaxID=2656650 RepID=A0A6A9UV49_9ACTN|nr:hypothetical protein [Auraticoccus cholistanensis]MVA76826.1 hypothetical protein [Auraticoccus cholistanensis]
MHPTPPAAGPREALGLPPAALVGLAAVGLPGAVLRQLHLVGDDGPVPLLLAVGPVVLWIAVAVVRRVPNPFLAVLVTGTLLGVMTVVSHQLLWEASFRGTPPAIGVGPAATVLPRVGAVLGGLSAGAVTGAVGGLVAWGLQRLSSVGRR